MSAYGREFHDDVVQVQHEQPDSFGSGRLIGQNLVLTARHVVRPEGATVNSGWKVRRNGDRPRDWPVSPWNWHDATIIHVSEKHDVAVLRICGPTSLTPFYRTRIATAISQDDRPVQGAGFPSGFRCEEKAYLAAPTGGLQDDRGPRL